MIKRMQFTINAPPDSFPATSSSSDTFSSEGSTGCHSKMGKTSESYFGCSINDAIVTIPVYF
ncbi:hypothetical protein K503DRAFT_775279 [Rhizopogon vinicolor AM-OR11-026]|uniref:Uncharacterized protein n=1 Tax=Rhizopogon vinicolor AM-OR11-026 TaxID=1314800 RepID=A0A1B7MMC1_9AGAM|nr:hypothetical protein K503DRAFT_775279 [Rhizopogon vinicolor AM-OR11-026]